jgi:type IV fimbrial biogenesis protein FimT
MENYHSKSTSGFTLLELLVVLVIIAVLSAFAIPAFSQSIQRYRAAAEISALGTDLQLARSEAVKRGLSVVVCPTSDGKSCTSASGWQIGWMVYPVSLTSTTTIVPIRYQKAWTNSDTLVSNNSSPYLITFSREGYASILSATTAGTVIFKVQTSAVSKCLELNKAGRQAIGSCA